MLGRLGTSELFKRRIVEKLGMVQRGIMGSFQIVKRGLLKRIWERDWKQGVDVLKKESVKGGCGKE